MGKIGGKALLAVFMVLSLAAAVSPASANSSEDFAFAKTNSISTVTVAEATSMTGLINASDYSPDTHGDLLRLYRAFFDREPDIGGAKYWIDINKQHNLDEIAGWMSDGQEFFNNYNGTTNREFLERVYQNILGREYDQGGFDYWLAYLEGTNDEQPGVVLSRGLTVRWVAKSQELRNNYPYSSADIGGHTPAEALPLAGATFFVEDRYGDQNWIGELVGIVPTAVDEGNETPGTCYTVIGTVAPARLDEGIHVGDTPDFGLIAEGTEIDSSPFGDCDAGLVRAAGYELYPKMTLETDAPFYMPFFLPATGPQILDTVFVGDPDSTTATFFSPDTSAAIPPPPNSNVGRDQFLKSALPFTNTPWLHEPAYQGVEWTGVMGALVESEPQSFVTDPGYCVHLVGTITPNRIDDGTVTTGFDAPVFGMLVGGRLLNPAFRCEDGPAETAGYGERWDAKVGVGTTYPFYQDFFIPADLGTDIDAIVVGSGTILPTTYYRVPALASEYPAP